MNNENRFYKKQKNSKDLIKDCDILVRDIILIMYVDIRGLYKCFTCDKKHTKKDIEVGHYITRKYYHARWDMFNCRPQCITCNQFLKGNLSIYRDKLILEDKNKLEKLEKEKKILFKISKNILLDIYNNLSEYKEDLKNRCFENKCKIEVKNNNTEELKANIELYLKKYL